MKVEPTGKELLNVGFNRHKSKPDEQIRDVEDCFKLLEVKQEKKKELFVPATVQFKIKNFTEVDFENLTATVNGLFSISFLIFTADQDLQRMLLDRLYWNEEELQIIHRNRRKKIEREANVNFVPVMFNKDNNIKLPTTRNDEFQIQAFKSRVNYEKGGTPLPGWRVFHVIRKEFKVEIIKNSWKGQFLAPFNRINLDLNITLDHMELAPFEFKDKEPPKGERLSFEEGEFNQRQKERRTRQDRYMKYIEGDDCYREIGFNILRIEEPYKDPKMDKYDRTDYFSPMLNFANDTRFGKYDLVETEVEAYTHDERELLDEQNDFDFDKLLADKEPSQKYFSPFKYALFKIPLFRHSIVDLMTIFIPIWLLSFMSVYIFFETAEIMNRIMNVSALMIAYAAIQPIVRENLPDATTITLVDILIYLELGVNVLFLVRSIGIRSYDDEPTATGDGTNNGYNRWVDPYFIVSIILSVLNFFIIMVLVIKYLIQKPGYQVDEVPKKIFAINEGQNWTLKLLMDRAFARYREELTFLPYLK